MSRTAASLLAIVLGLAGAVGGFFYGQDQGVAAEAGRRDAQTVKDLTALIDSHQRLVKEAGAASTAMRRATAQRAALDARTTKEFKDALARNSDSRAGCVFDDDIVRGLTAARDAAAQAAASGIRGAVPGAAAGPAGQ